MREMKLAVNDTLGVIMMYCLHRIHVVIPAHKLRAIGGGEPKLVMRYGA